MTMQVGMVGSDGVLIASDTLRTNEPNWLPSLSEKPLQVRQTFGASKIIVAHDGGIAISSAKIMNTAERVANEIIAGLKDGEMAQPRKAIEQIGADVLPFINGNERKIAHCLIAIIQPPPARLYSFEFTYEAGPSGPICKPICHEVETSVAAGDNVNAAVFWKERYYREQPIRKLVPLAAHMIVSASKLNSGSIRGLEIVLCKPSGIRRIDKKSIHKLLTQANRWDKQIGSLFSNYRQDFTFSDKAAG